MPCFAWAAPSFRKINPCRAHEYREAAIAVCLIHSYRGLAVLVANIVKLALGVSPARSFLNSDCLIQLSKTGIAVSLQDPAKALEMNARMAGPALPVDASTPELAREWVARLRGTLR